MDLEEAKLVEEGKKTNNVFYMGYFIQKIYFLMMFFPLHDFFSKNENDDVCNIMQKGKYDLVFWTIAIVLYNVSFFSGVSKLKTSMEKHYDFSGVMILSFISFLCFLISISLLFGKEYLIHCQNCPKEYVNTFICVFFIYGVAIFVAEICNMIKIVFCKKQ